MTENVFKIASQLLSNDNDYLERVVELKAIGDSLHGQCWDTEFHIFALIASELDHLPLEHVRKQCNSEFLAKADKELSEAIDFYRIEVTSACKKILKNHSRV
ncbi:hypothetical protein BCT30_16550 [Enterovibrio norvegicus]|uniref:hypothetical protein n=1 Tax=Enterovibrio norvegicus TaxID=188144 RepID=UPI0002FA08D6|nr:hypothetical protein [Enterovibrio norvegicus]MCC4796843.1 hypothetical protein [Enterovibrio norvegicus]OEF55823.1 hypothetical protein A1OU_13625 [Enterovibrio norvegicus]OEF59421.1 hypothetical protein A1OW_21595 [Enterovibrio norvegicus]PMI35148.1 hypothetical protein BCU46_19695 [Enterovibrio norvegicus]PMN50493.1 hypothetical protein BCT30_16550 [Enterovibrio norvegicus]